MIRTGFCNKTCKHRFEHEIGSISQCLHCGNNFIKTRKDKVYCSNGCAQYDQKIKKGTLTKRYKEVAETSGFTLEVREFFLQCKEKKWMLTRGDILKLVNFYSEKFPTRYNHDSLTEDDYITMVLKLKYKLKI
jgi:hypothetical protein